MNLRLAFLSFVLGACGDKPEVSDPKPAPGTPSEVTVFAASSLTEAFQELERAFETAHPEVNVMLNLAGSQALRLQIEQGAPADVFASANESHMTSLVSGNLIHEAHLFAANELVIVVPTDNPANIQSFDDLPHAPQIVVGAPDVPVGSYTNEMLARAETERGAEFRRQVEEHIVSREANVRLVLAKVELGEADAAIVYRTDARTTDRVRAIEIPVSLAGRALYHIGVVARTEHGTAATQWIELVRSPEGRAVLDRHGFILDDIHATAEAPLE